ncbi:MAG: alkaline phosphatase family protein [Candidatus Eisenbacteria bacterium]|nr:alkaline phosphatase family protein [Candidatus Eisenbacteria bacterium]
MKKACIVFLIDALGWEILAKSGVEFPEFREKRRLKTVLGYSGAAIPSLLSGRPPGETGHWAMYFHAPQSSPFSATRLVSWLPRRILRRKLSSAFLKWLVEVRAGIKGYYSLYEIPFEYFRFFDLCEKKNIFSENGLNACPNIFDELSGNGIEYRVWDWRAREEENFKEFTQELRAGILQFFFFYTPELDAVIHKFGTGSERVVEKLRLLSEMVTESAQTASEYYDDVHILVVSDHGMVDTTSVIDSSVFLDTVKFSMPDDYLVFLDSTMARFWFSNKEARESFSSRLSALKSGRILTVDELKQLGAYFPDGRFGELIFLTSPGTLIVPSFMGKEPLKAMHGFHPSHPGCDALAAGNHSLPDLSSILDIFGLIKSEISWLKRRSET